MFSENQCRIARVAHALVAYRHALVTYRKYAALGREMTKYSLANQARIERVARALYDAAPSESEGEPEPSLDEQGERAEPKALSWDELDDAQYPIKQEFRVMATIAIEAMTLDDGLDEGLRQFQLPAIMAELTSLNKTDALRVLNAAIDQVMEAQ
jgi:hypothetical protein